MGLLTTNNHSQLLSHTNHLLILGVVTFLVWLNPHDLLLDGCFELSSVLSHCPEDRTFPNAA